MIKKVFISSVMKGFGDERASARKAVESLRMTPVMAEEFGAKPHSSQIACLEGVHSCDIFVLILALRYGFVAQSGKSVTEEEFEEARQRGLDILVFVQKGEMEPAQKRLLDRIGSYEEGYFVNFFENPHELQTQVTSSVFDLAGQPDITVLNAESAKDRTRRFLGARGDGMVALLGAVIFPARAGEEYFPPLEMGSEIFKNTLAQQAMFGQSAVFNPQRGFSTKEGREHIQFYQSDRRGRLANKLELHSDGTIFLQGSVCDEDDAGSYSLMRQFVINQEVVFERLKRFWSFANVRYGGVHQSSRISSLYGSASISNISQKYLGKWLEDSQYHGIQVPMTPIDDPLIVPVGSNKVSRADLVDASKLAEKYVGLFLRAFRAAGRELGNNKLTR